MFIQLWRNYPLVEKEFFARFSGEGIWWLCGKANYDLPWHLCQGLKWCRIIGF